MTENQQVNFTIVPDADPAEKRVYANFCGIEHTPFDFTLTFCEVLPLSEATLREAQSDHVVRAPVRSRVVLPVQAVPALIAALQEHLRVYSEGQPQGPQPVPPTGPATRCIDLRGLGRHLNRVTARTAGPRTERSELLRERAK